MGKLKPGATYIYERANGVTYAREAGADPLTREAIGWDADAPGRPDALNDLKESKLWGDIRRAAVDNPLLQEALNRVKIVYQLSRKDNGQE
jgi:hypothetical protein|tara:strand:- start:6488 stop:6760 length:273 start_codon:yes stop_codon:yes gene_type:complete